MINKLFLDSGAFSLYTLKAKKEGLGYSFYETDEFWKYVDDYCLLIKKNKAKFSIFVTVDVLFKPKLSWKVFNYIRDVYKITPLPVFHFPKLHRTQEFQYDGNFNQSGFKWLKKYMDNCEYLGLGGLGVEITKRQFIPYADRVFKLLCDNKGTPRWKVHGFAMTSLELMIRYPWASVDSSSFQIEAGFGTINCPPIKGQKYEWLKQNQRVCLSPLSASSKKYEHYNIHLDNNSFVNEQEKENIKKYINTLRPNTKIGISEYIEKKLTYELKENERWFKKENEKNIGIIEKVKEKGIGNDGFLRKELNLLYYAHVMEEIRKISKSKIFDIYFVSNSIEINNLISKYNQSCLISYFYLKKQNEEFIKNLKLDMPKIFKKN